MKFVLRINWFSVCKALRSAWHNKCCASVSSYALAMVLILRLPTRFCQGERRQKEDGEKTMCIWRGNTCEPWSCDRANWRGRTCGKEDEGGWGGLRCRHWQWFFVVPLLAHPTPLILSPLLATSYTASFEILLNIETEWSQLLWNLQFSKRFWRTLRVPHIFCM